MIIYATKQTFERYKLKLPSELSPTSNVIAETVIKNESGNKLLEWGAKLFYFDKRKCIQMVNFASKFTLFLVDVKVADLENVGDMIAFYLLELYKDDKQMTAALKKMFEVNPLTCFAKLTDKSAIATLNTTQRGFADDGYRFYEFIRGGILHTMEINYEMNFKWLFTMKTGEKTEYIYAGEKLREIVLERYGKLKHR
ncbi:MAG: hypothetical protein RR769_08300 [Anaerovoracaceae bacterium]